MIMGHGPPDVVRIDKDDIKPLVDLPLYVLGMLEQMFTAGGRLGLIGIIKIAVGTVPVAVIVVFVISPVLLSTLT